MRGALFGVLLVCGLVYVSALPSPWEMQAMLEVSATSYEPCGAPKCPGSTQIPQGYQCNCHWRDEHPLCGCDKFRVQDLEKPAEVDPLPKNDADLEAALALPSDHKDYGNMPFSKSTTPPGDVPPMADNECIPNVYEVSPGTCVTGAPNPGACGNPTCKDESEPATPGHSDAKVENPPAATNAAAAPSAPAPAPAAATTAAPKDSSADKSATKEQPQSPDLVAKADEVATASIAATAKASVQTVKQQTESVKEEITKEKASKEDLKKTMTALEAEAEKVNARKTHELSVEHRVEEQKAELIKQRQQLEAVLEKLEHLNTVVQAAVKAHDEHVKQHAPVSAKKDNPEHEMPEEQKKSGDEQKEHEEKKEH